MDRGRGGGWKEEEGRDGINIHSVSKPDFAHISIGRDARMHAATGMQLLVQLVKIKQVSFWETGRVQDQKGNGGRKKSWNGGMRGKKNIRPMRPFSNE